MRFSQPFALSLGLVLAACASAPKPHVSGPHGSGPPASSRPGVPGVKIGNPYQVYGITYVPEDDRGYDRQGTASWYGPTFHQKATANGETYNQDDVTAAHKTLPMPSWVEVTNLDNGRKLVVRINDRGPFVDGRIIDLSKRSAELLGVDRPGLALVRVKRIFPEGDWARAEPARQPPVQLASAPTPRTASDFSAVPAPAVPVAAGIGLPPVPVAVAVAPPAPVAATPAGRFIQVAALSDEGRAKALASVLTDFGPAEASLAPGGMWRVRIGPVAQGQVENLLFDVQSAGYRDARLVK